MALLCPFSVFSVWRRGWPRYKMTPILTKRFEQGGCKVHHGGFPGYTRVCSEVEDEPGQAHRVADNEYGSRRAMPR